MAKNTSRGARLTALALATGTLVVSATSSAGAAAIAVPDVYGGSANGRAIHIKINLPVAIPAPAPLGSIQSLEQSISFTEGNASKGVAPKPVAVTKATLGDGNVVVLSDLLEKQVVASLDGSRSANDSLLGPINVANLIKVSAGEISSKVTPDADGSALSTDSSAKLLDFRVGLGSLSDSLPLKTELDSTLDQLSDLVAEDGQVSQTLDGVLSLLDEASEGASAPVTQVVETVKTEVRTLLENLTQTLGNLSADTDLVRLGLLQSTSKVSRVGDKVVADATAEVGGLSLLGGLVTLEAAKSTSHSEANGIKGSAKAGTDTFLAKVHVADTLDLTLGPDGLTGSLLGQDIPAAVRDAFDTVLKTLNQVLALAGVQIVNGATTSNTDPNGQFASSGSLGIGIIVNPLKAAVPLVSVQLVPVNTAVNAARFKGSVAPPRSNTPPTVSNPRGPLPHTGAELPLFAVIGTGLAGVALVARRRRRVEV